MLIEAQQPLGMVASEKKGEEVGAQALQRDDHGRRGGSVNGAASLCVGNTAWDAA